VVYWRQEKHQIKTFRTTSFGCWLTAASLLLPHAAHGQYTADFQTNTVNAVTNNWGGVYYVGYTNFADVLLIQNGGVLNSGAGYLGYSSGSSNSSVIVTGTGSVWNSSGFIDIFRIGNLTSGNSLVIGNGGAVSIPS